MSNPTNPQSGSNMNQDRDRQQQGKNPAEQQDRTAPRKDDTKKPSDKY